MHDEIRDHGPITFARYMELSLYGPGGFYEDPPVGAGGDFVTGPHVHPVFGELVGVAIRELHEGLGRPAPFRIAEVGAGDGTLATQVLAALDDLEPQYQAVEISAGARLALDAIPGLHVADALEGTPHVVLAHELLDNLPFRVVRDGREVRVGLDGDRLVERLVDLDDALAPWAGSEGETVVPPGALAFVDDLAERLRPGYALLIDYGGEGTAGGEVHGYRGHRVVADVLAAPGSTDITAGVDFTLIADRARERGLQAFAPVTQHRALLALGFEAWVRGQLDRQQELLGSGDGMEAVRLWSGRSRATLLADPAALGRLRWLLLASQGLPAPPWHGSAEGPS